MSAWKLPEGVTEADIDASAGFVYIITRKDTGRRYVGKKWTKRQIKRRFVISRWRSYWGTSKPLSAEIAQLGHDLFEREIIAIYPTRGEVDYAEVEMMFALDVLRARLPDGSRAFYNIAMLARWFRAPK